MPAGQSLPGGTGCPGGELRPGAAQCCPPTCTAMGCINPRTRGQVRCRQDWERYQQRRPLTVTASHLNMLVTRLCPQQTAFTWENLNFSNTLERKYFTAA